MKVLCCNRRPATDSVSLFGPPHVAWNEGNVAYELQHSEDSVGATASMAHPCSFTAISLMDPMESISSLLAAMKSGTLTSTGLVERCLARIETGDRDLRVWVSVDASGARAAAARADEIYVVA